MIESSVEPGKIDSIGDPVDCP